MKVFIVLLALFSVAFSAPVEIGTCYLRGTANDPTVTGTITFTLVGNQVQVEASISGITSNPTAQHGMHIHQYGDLTSTTGTATGAHYDPAGTNVHACPPTTPRHAGDMGNWTATAGSITQSKTLDLITLTGTGSIIGRAVILHDIPDDCSVPAGLRIAQCVIGLGNPGDGNNNPAVATPSVTSAICVLRPTAATATNNVAGIVILEQSDPNGPTRVYAEITGLDGNPHGFHIHEIGDVSSANATAALGHWNPLGVNHGIPPYPIRHMGDMGNIYHYVTGTAYYDYTNDKLSLTGENPVIGHTIIVHMNADTCEAPVGNAGSRLAQCVIGVKNPATTPPTIPAMTPTTQDDAPCVALYGTAGTDDNFASIKTAGFGMIVVAMIVSSLF